MTLHRAIAKTAAETRLAEQFAALRGAAPSPWLAAAFGRFEEAGLPTRRVEAWHYTDVRAALTSAAPLAETPDASAIAAARQALASLARAGGARLVMLDGRFAAALSDAPPAGVALAPAAPETPAPDGADAMLALNFALTLGGCALTIEAGAQAPLIEIVHCLSPGAKSVYSRLALTLGPGASASLIERFVGAASSAQRNVSTWIALAAGAKAAHVASIEDDAGLHVESLVADLAARAELDAFGFVAGGALTRRQSSPRWPASRRESGSAASR